MCVRKITLSYKKEKFFLFKPYANAEEIAVLEFQSDIRDRSVSILLHRYHDILGE